MAKRWARPKKTNNLTIFDQAERAKQEGMEAAYQYADVDWKKIASDALRKCAETMPEFTSDDVWEIINKTGITTSENRAYGAIVQAAHRAGIIQPTPNFIQSKRPQVHKNPIRIWQSRIYKPGGRKE